MTSKRSIFLWCTTRRPVTTNSCFPCFVWLIVILFGCFLFFHLYFYFPLHLFFFACTIHRTEVSSHSTFPSETFLCRYTPKRLAHNVLFHFPPSGEQRTSSAPSIIIPRIHAPACNRPYRIFQTKLASHLRLNIVIVCPWNISINGASEDENISCRLILKVFCVNEWVSFS